MAAFSAGSPKASQPIGCSTLKPAHPLVAGEEVADRVDAHVAHVDAAGRIREHLEAVELRAAGLLGDLELLARPPRPPATWPRSRETDSGPGGRRVAILALIFNTLSRGGQETAPRGPERPPGDRPDRLLLLEGQVDRLAASSALATDSACLPASWSFLASLASVCGLLGGVVGLARRRVLTCLISSGH